MTVAAALLLYVLAVLAAGPSVLSRITAGGEAPRLAIAAWLTAVVTVIGCSVGAIAALLIEIAGHWDSPDGLLVSCLARLRAILLGHSGWPAQIVMTVAVAVAVGSMLALCLRVCCALARMRSQTFEHAAAVHLVGRSGGNDVVVIDASEPAAYCVAGRPPAIVITTAAMAALESAPLAAVLAHERAHLDGRHAHLIAAVRGLAAAMPGVTLFASAAARIGALLEMCADDTAIRRHGRAPLLAGLLAMSNAVTPAAGLGAATTAVGVRAQRLSDPQRGMARLHTRATLSGAVAAMAATPVVIATLSLSGVLLCFA